SDAIQVKSAWGEQAYPDLRSAVRETLDALEAPMAELRARMPATVPVSAADRNLDREPEAVRTDSVMMQLDRPTHTNVWATPDLEGQRIVLRTPPADQIPADMRVMPNRMYIGMVESVNPTTGNDARITMQVTHQGDMDNIPTDYNAAMERVTSRAAPGRDADYQRMHFPASIVTMDDGISADIEAAIHAADQRYAAAHPLIPAAVARFMGDTQKERIATLLNGPDGNTSVMLSPDNIRAQLERLNRWAGTASITVMEDAEANGLNATGQMALRNAANGDLMFVCALSDDDATGYGLILQTMTHRATLKILNLTDLGTDTWIVDLTHEAQPLLDILAHQGYSQRDVTVERMVRSTISAPAPEMVRIEKAGLSEMAQGGPSYQSAIETIESAGGWDAVTDSPALQKSLQDQLDHLIQLRAEQVSQVLQEGGWKWSSAAFSRPDAENSMGFKIFPNGRSAGGNMVHWGYRITQRDGETPVSLDMDDDMTLGAADLVQSMLQRMEPPQPVVDSSEAVRAIPSDGKPSPEMQNHLDVVRPFVSESQFNGIRHVLSGESGIEAVQSEALHLERLAQWITQPYHTSPVGLHTNGGHLRPDDAAVQSVSATCVLAYQNQSGTRKTYLTGMDDLGNLYGIRIRTRAIAGPVNLINILNQGELLNLTMQPTPVAELLKEDGYFPEGVFHEPAVTAIHEPYRA
ncbi:hypothetical protein HAP94_21620, partial [Acidithiobacillus ferrivorans]|nr:hypothetical protein [Acidithiobacillus ferrivorans]